MGQPTLQLVIAEKHSVAEAIAAALDVPRHRDGYYLGNGLLITHCVGHLIELVAPESYDERLKQWRREDLPFIPDSFQHQVISKTSKQFQLIKQLLAREDVGTVINACDAGREGELIFDLVFKKANADRPVLRAWIQSLTVSAIREGFRNLRPGAAYSGLCAAAHARQRADWLIGINATRAQTLVARAGGATSVYSLGRVQTPTLALVVDRDLAIERFQPTDFYRIRAAFTTPKGETYQAWWFKPGADGGIVDRFERADAAHDLVRKIAASKQGRVVLVNQKPIKHKPPQLFNLSQLQREANRIHGFTIARTLEIAQSLYEKKAITYPRTSSQYINQDLNAQIAQHFQPFHGTPFGEYVAAITAHRWQLKPHHVDDKKVTDHHAILPTTQRVDFTELSANERIIFEMIARRFLAAFYPDAIDERTQIVSTCAGENFVTRGTRELEPGWRAVDPPQSAKAKAESEEGADGETEEPDALPAVVAEMTLEVGGCESVKRQTKAPSRLTEGMLLSAMETAGRVVEDAEMREAMKQSGLGTDATRAAILEKLLERSYVVRESKKKFIRSTPAGRELIARLRQSKGGAAVLASPEMTGAQEAKLARIERNEITLTDFMSEIGALTRAIVPDIFAQDGTNTLALPQDLIPCPNCKFAGRESFLRVRVGKEQKEFMACAAPREVCAYVTEIPKLKSHIAALVTKSCPKCSSALRLRFGKEKKTPFLSCTKFPDCKGVVWFEKRKKKSKADETSEVRAAA